MTSAKESHLEVVPEIACAPSRATAPGGGLDSFQPAISPRLTELVIASGCSPSARMGTTENSARCSALSRCEQAPGPLYRTRWTAVLQNTAVAGHLTRLAQDALVFRLLLKMTVGKSLCEAQQFLEGRRPTFACVNGKLGKGSRQPAGTARSNHRLAHA